MKILIVGATNLTERVMREIHSLDSVRICGVITSPKTFQISYSRESVVNMKHADLTSICDELAIPHISTDNGMKNQAITDFIESVKPDLMVVCGWYYMIGKSIRDIVPAIGVHASLLPKYAGGAPLVWAMLEGEPETGVSVFGLTDGVDNGKVYGQVSFEILQDDDISDLIIKSEEASIALLKELFISGALMGINPDSEPKNVVEVYRQRSPDDAELDPSGTPEYFERMIKSQTHPYSGAFSVVDQKKVVIWKANVIQYCGAMGILHSSKNLKHLHLNNSCIEMLEFEIRT